VNRLVLAVALTALLPGCAQIPSAAVGAIAGATGAAFNLDDDILNIVTGHGSTKVVKGKVMTTFTIPTDAEYKQPIVWVDQVGRSIAAPAGGTVSIDNSAVASAALSADGSEITVTPASAGTANLVYTNGSVSLPAQVVVVTPTPSSAGFGIGALAQPGS
jgi:type IV pilus biogenesis protein CpaD/CtpE